MLSMSLSPCCRFHPAETNSRIGHDAVVAKRPELFDQAVIEFLVPFAGEKRYDFGAPIDELRSVPPAAILGVAE